MNGEPDERTSTLSVLALGSAILRSARLLVVLPLTFAAAGLGVAYLTSDYVAQSQFSPQEQQAPSSNVLNTAQQFGFDVASLGMNMGGNSVEFYARLLDTDELLRQAVEHEYRFARQEGSADTLSGNLIELYDIEEDTPQEEVREAIQELRERIQISRSGAANVVAITVEAEWRHLAEQINRRLLDLVNEYNIEKRQSQASMERKFVRERLSRAAEELEKAEEDLESFLSSNRRVSGSPELEMEAERLRRQVRFRQQIYTNLYTAFEQARIDEVRDTPVLTVIDSPEGTGERRGRYLVTSIVAAMLGLFGAVMWALTRAYVRLARESAPEEWEKLVGEARHALPRLTR